MSYKLLYCQSFQRCEIKCLFTQIVSKHLRGKASDKIPQKKIAGGYYDFADS